MLPLLLACSEYGIEKKASDPAEPDDTACPAEEPRQDNFLQEADPIDVLWVIDNSSSMAQEQARVIAEIASFFDWFETLGTDYHMGVVTSDVVTPTMQGRLQGSPAWIEPSTPDPEAALALRLAVGTDDQGDESGLLAAELALSEPLRSTENDGFLRPEARLLVVFLSDEPEQSTYDAQHYIDFFGVLKEDRGRVSAAAIVGDAVDGCSGTCDGTDQAASGGDKYIDIATALGGVFGSICTCDLSPTLDAIGLQNTLYTRTFALTEVPLDPTGVLVWVDGAETRAFGWDPETNALIFTTPPVAGARLRAEYTVASECDQQ